MGAICLLGLFTVAAAGPIPPPPTRWVTDNAGFLSGSTAETLNERLRRYQDATGHQVLVWIGKTTGGDPIEDWAERAFKQWRICRQRYDDGLILFIMADDRTARIEVGYGLEGQVPDATASRIINESLIAKIKAGDRDGAVSESVDRLLGAIGGEDGETGSGGATPIEPFQVGFTIFLIVIVIVISIRYPAVGYYILSILTSSSRRGGGGGSGPLGGGGRSGGGGASGRW